MEERLYTGMQLRLFRVANKVRQKEIAARWLRRESEHHVSSSYIGAIESRDVVAAHIAEQWYRVVKDIIAERPR